MPGQPQNTPTIQKPTPIVLDQILVETSDSDKALYDRMLEFGHFHPDQIRYPAHRLIKQGPNSYGLYQYWWANDFTSQDSYNVAKHYAEESDVYPTYIRSYRVLRSDYLVTGPLAKGQPFTGVAAVLVTAGGTGYTKGFSVTGTGGSGTGFAGTAIVSRGTVVRIEITAVGANYASAPMVDLSAGDGAGATATAAIQEISAVLVEEKHDKLPEDDPYTSLYDRVIRVYMTMPGPLLITYSRSQEIRGIAVETDEQKALTGTLPVESGGLIISSRVSPVTAVIDQRITEKVAVLPPDELSYDYRYTDIPRRIFDLAPTVLCNMTDQVAVAFNPRTKPAGSFIRKHRTTVSYSETPPGDTALNIIVRADLDYDGKIIHLHYHGVLNDFISFSGDSTIGLCTWNESYTFAASSPSATSFSGQWWLVDRQTIPWGTTAWRTKTVEFYEP